MELSQPSSIAIILPAFQLNLLVDSKCWLLIKRSMCEGTMVITSIALRSQLYSISNPRQSNEEDMHSQLDFIENLWYKPPSEFQEVEVEPILKEALSDSTELWLIQMPLTQFEPADFAGKQLSLKLTKDDGWMGCLENSHGKSYDIFGLGKRGIERFAFMPNSKSMGVRKIARHICLLKSTNENGDASRIADSSVGFSGSQIQESVKREGISHDQGTSLGSTGCKSSQVASGISFEGEEPPTKGRKKFRKEGKLNGTPTASYSKSLEESGAYDSSDPQYHSPRTNKYTEDTYTGGKKKKPKLDSPKK